MIDAWPGPRQPGPQVMHNASEMFGKLLETETIVHETTSHGPVLEVIFRHGKPEEGRSIRQAIEDAIVTHEPAAILLNLREFRYWGGDYISSFLEAFIDTHARAIRPACFLVETQRKARSIRSLFDLMGPSFGPIEFFEDRETAIVYLKKRMKDTH